jgi:hypothetical protein
VSSYGFRVYSVVLHEGMGRKPIDTWQVGTSHYAAYAQDLCKMLAADSHLLRADPSWAEI